MNLIFEDERLLYLVVAIILPICAVAIAACVVVVIVKLAKRGNSSLYISATDNMTPVTL